MSERDRYAKLKSSLGAFLSMAGDLMLLNFLWLVCSLPILTMGPATSALFSVTLKLAQGIQVETVKEFFSAFKSNFKQAFALGLFGILAAVIIYTDGRYALSLEPGGFKIAFSVLTGVWIALLLTYFSYAFALEAKFQNTIKQHMKNVFLLAFCAPGRTILMWAIYLAPLLLFLMLPEYVVAYVGFLYLMMGISGPVTLGSRVLLKVFGLFMKDETAEEDDDEL